MPRLSFAPATEELATAAATLATGWRRQRASIDNLAASAQAIVDGLPDPLIAVDRQRRIVRTNLAARALLGPVGAERDLSTALRHPELLAAIDALLETADGNFTGPDQTAVEFVLSGPPELDVMAHLRRLPRAAADGSLALIVLHDTTALRRAERMRADFVANASHELKTPIAGIVGFIETLRGPARDDASRARALPRHHGRAGRAHAPPGRRSADAVAHRAARACPARRRDRPRPRAARRARSAAAQGRARARWRSSSASSRTCRAPSATTTSSPSCSRTWSTTRSSTPSPPPRCGWRRAALGPDRVAVAVSDEGDGIPAEHLPRLTERFYRVDAARSRQLGGTGLGLAIVKHVVNRHRGRLDIQSTPGKGSTFTVTLPTAD